MAAGLGFKTFATGDVLTAGDTNGYLMQGVWVFADAAARSAAVTSPQEGNISYLKDTNSTEYYSGSAWVAIGGGAAGGKVLQVVSATTRTTVTIASTTFTDTGLTATITPTVNTSKILVIVSQAYELFRAANTMAAGSILKRGSTTVWDGDEANKTAMPGIVTNATLTSFQWSGQVGVTYLDSPATTSATTYKMQMGLNTTANSCQVATNKTVDSTITLMEIGA